jgi:hypothetical protein
MMAALIPLVIRMAFIHVVLIWGTNNVETAGIHYTQLEVEHRSNGSRLVLAGRIFYAMFIWTSKLTISEFLKRITHRIWRRSYEITLQGIRVFLVLTFVVVVVATLCECQPFDHYWQVVPDPGPHCRQGYGNLIAMGTCDVITDILLIAFPIPIILQSGQTWKRKLQLASLFSLSIILIIITLFRVPKVIEMLGRQQYRTVWASSEILASTAVSNTVIIGSFLRDKGTKKNKYRSNSVADSIDRGSARRPTVTALQNTGSDEDLFRFLGIRVPTHLQDQSEQAPRPAPVAEPASRHPSRGQIAKIRDSETKERGENSSDSDDSLHKPAVPASNLDSTSVSSTNRLSLFDIGGLLEGGAPRSTPSSNSRTDGLPNGVLAHDFAPSTPSQSRRTSQVQDIANTPTGSRRGSRNAVMLQDFGGLLTPSASRASSGMDRYHGRRQSDSHLHPPSRHNRPAPTGVLGPMLERHETQYSLQDAGGLLGNGSERPSGRLERIMSDSAAEGIPPNVTNFSRPRTQASSSGSAAADDIELSDLGGILSDSHEPDASAAAFNRATNRSRRRSPPRSVPAPQLQQGSGWEIMDIQDPGGLLGK